MAPARRRAQQQQQQSLDVQQTEQAAVNGAQNGNNQDVDNELFIDPMLGIPLAIYIEKDVHDRDLLVELITKHGGTVSPGYSSVPYILVDPHKPSGQNLYRQYASKKGKIILDARWVHECINAGQLQTFHTNWGGCKVTGEEMNTPQTSTPNAVVSTAGPSNLSIPDGSMPTGDAVSSSRRRSRHSATQMAPPPPPQAVTHVQPSQTVQQSPAQPQPQEAAIPPPVTAVVQSPFPSYPFLIAHPRPIHPNTEAATQPWQSQPAMAIPQTHIAPQQTQHMLQRAASHGWEGYESHPGNPMNGDPSTYDYRYRDEQWAQPPRNEYYDSLFEEDNTYEQPQPYIEQQPASTPGAAPSTPVEPAERTRDRKRTRSQFNAPAAPASSLVTNRIPPARSPTPPTRVIKSTYGGNLFTAEDVIYLKKYIDYCQEQGLVLSLREICERIAIKAPHHTFYSWRRYCNKHQIRLGGYLMNQARVIAPTDQEADGEQQDIEDQTAMDVEIDTATVDLQTQGQPPPQLQNPAPIENNQPRDRSPTPPRALYRSTTGKGVAFTNEDVTFLVRFMEYRKSQGPLDMVLFWKEVAAKAPHHSRASWMKFWRRHKHELNRTETDEPLPQPPDKKMRYSREDDILLAKYFAEKPEGTSDKIFQAFGRLHPHHPWKGWQEHHRIHKTKIDHLVKQIQDGESIDVEMAAALA